LPTYPGTRFALGSCLRPGKGHEVINSSTRPLYHLGSGRAKRDGPGNRLFR